MRDSTMVGLEGNVGDFETLSVQGLYAEYYHAAGESITNNLIWFDESAGMVFTIDGDAEKDVILRMAESVTLASSPKT